MIIDAICCVVMLISAIVAMRTRDLMYAMLSLAALSLFLSLQFYIMQAPDVAIAEAGVGVLLSSIIYIFAIKKTARSEDA